MDVFNRVGVLCWYVLFAICLRVIWDGIVVLVKCGLWRLLLYTAVCILCMAVDILGGGVLF